MRWNVSGRLLFVVVVVVVVMDVWMCTGGGFHLRGGSVIVTRDDFGRVG